MRLSPEKMAHLAQVIAARLKATAAAPNPGFSLARTDLALRQRALTTLRAFSDRDEQCAETARQKIRTLKRVVPEGSHEWQALFQQHYNQELDRLRKVR